MIVRFVARIPANHKTILTVEMDSVPREGEVVSIDNASYAVHSVSWDINKDEQRAVVLLA